MNKNVNLHKAKKAKNDEFYTRLEDIEAELSHYPISCFRDKVIYCPCDVGVEGLDIPKSNFIKYFEDNKDRLGYKKLIHTSLQEGFDYRSEYCQKLFKEADVVVTNPPFSLFRDFVACLEQHNLKYIIMGNKNALTFKDIFPLIIDNKLWLGHSKMGTRRYFTVPNDYVENLLATKDKSNFKEINGKLCFHAPNCWFTNLDHIKRHESLLLVKKYDPALYPRYDNYDAINVDKVSDIPYDYDGVMGVPITFLDKYNPGQFEILGSQSWCKSPELVAVYCGNKKTCEEDHNTLINGKVTYFRIFIRKKAGA